jgi:hypothetical protein
MELEVNSVKRWAGLACLAMGMAMPAMAFDYKSDSNVSNPQKMLEAYSGKQFWVDVPDGAVRQSIVDSISADGGKLADSEANSDYSVSAQYFMLAGIASATLPVDKVEQGAVVSIGDVRDNRCYPRAMRYLPYPELRNGFRGGQDMETGALASQIGGMAGQNPLEAAVTGLVAMVGRGLFFGADSKDTNKYCKDSVPVCNIFQSKATCEQDNEFIHAMLTMVSDSKSHKPLVVVRTYDKHLSVATGDLAQQHSRYVKEALTGQTAPAGGEAGRGK